MLKLCTVPFSNTQIERDFLLMQNEVAINHESSLAKCTDDYSVSELIFWSSIFKDKKELSTLMLKLCTVPFGNAQIKRDFP